MIKQSYFSLECDFSYKEKSILEVSLVTLSIWIISRQRVRLFMARAMKFIIVVGYNVNMNYFQTKSEIELLTPNLPNFKD